MSPATAGAWTATRAARADPVTGWDDWRSPWQADRDQAEETGAWPDPEWGPHHRHFASAAIHRDGGPECDQPGTPRRVIVFDEDYLDQHERAIVRWVFARLARPGATLADLTGQQPGES